MLFAIYVGDRPEVVSANDIRGAVELARCRLVGLAPGTRAEVRDAGGNAPLARVGEDLHELTVDGQALLPFSEDSET